MGSKDLVFPTKKIEQTLTFDLDELVSILNTWFEERGYGLLETKHVEKQGEEQRSLIKFNLCADKKVDPYVKQVIDIDFFANVKDVIVEVDEQKKKVQDGTVSVEFTGYLKKDSEDDWTLKSSKGSSKSFLRELYDKYFNKNKMDKFESDLSKDINDIIAELKAYLKLHKF